MNAQRWTVRWFATFTVLMGILVLSTGQARASLGEFSFSSSFGPFGFIENLAVDESTGDIYVYDSGASTIGKFDAVGNPVDFSALGSNTIAGVHAGGGDETELAVDNSSGPAKGDIYAAGGGVVMIFGADGKALGELTAVEGRPWGEVACGVAVDGAGNVYVGLYPSFVNKYTPTANPVTNSDYTTSLGGLNEICNIAADPEGGVYVSAWFSGPIVKYNPQLAGAKQIVASAFGHLAVANSSSAELFEIGNKEDEIHQYDAAGNPLSTFGTKGASYRSVAVNAKTGRLYAANNNGRLVEVWQGVIIPDVRTGLATGLDPAGGATLNGSVNPEGDVIESCSFQYGTSVAYGSVASCAQPTPITGNSSVAVSAAVSGIVPNHTYHYQLATTDAHGTRHGADETFTIGVLPTVEDQAPAVSSIARTSVTLTGTIDPEQGDTRYRFEYGTSESYGASTPVLHTGDGITGDITVSQALGELSPDTIYHYRLVADNVAGSVAGSDHTFTTAAPTPPGVVTGGPNGVIQNTATLTGAVNTNGLSTTYGFELGTSTDYGPPTGLGSVGAGSNETPVSLALTGLQPGTTYHYRLTATNVDGTSHGADQTFTTSTFTNALGTPPASLPFIAVPAIAFPPEATGGPTTTPKTLTRAQKLAGALKACRKKAKSKRAGCEKRARQKYGAVKKKGKTK